MSLPSPIHSNYWKERILTDEEYAQTIEAAKVIVAEDYERVKKHRETVKAFLDALPAMGFSPHSSEYRYVKGRIVPKPKWGLSSLVSDIEWTQRTLKQKAAEEARKREDAAERRAKLAELAKTAQELGVDITLYFGDENGLKRAIREAQATKLGELLEAAPYYVKASFYGHCLRGDWSSGTDSYGYDELRGLSIPDEDPDRPELNNLAKVLVEIAETWDGQDGRDFRDTYQWLDSRLNEEDSKMLATLLELHAAVRYP